MSLLETDLTLSQKSTESLTVALLDSCASTMPKAIKLAARSALKQACSTGPLKKVGPALASRGSHKNKDVAEAAMVYLEQVMVAMAAKSEVPSLGDGNLSRIFAALNIGVNAKAPAAKKSAREICVILCTGLGSETYNTHVSKISGASTLQIEELMQLGITSAKQMPKKGASDAAAARKAQMKALRDSVSEPLVPE